MQLTNERVQQLWLAAVETAKEQLIIDGYILPKKVEIEVKFKPGDPVEVKEQSSGRWFLRRLLEDRGNGYVLVGGRYKTEEGSTWGECRHAPTSIKWEYGPIPNLGHFLIHWDTDYYEVMHCRIDEPFFNTIKRWTWMPK